MTPARMGVGIHSLSYHHSWPPIWHLSQIHDRHFVPSWLFALSSVHPHSLFFGPPRCLHRHHAMPLSSSSSSPTTVTLAIRCPVFLGTSSHSGTRPAAPRRPEPAGPWGQRCRRHRPFSCPPFTSHQSRAGIVGGTPSTGRRHPREFRSRSNTTRTLAGRRRSRAPRPESSSQEKGSHPIRPIPLCRPPAHNALRQPAPGAMCGLTVFTWVRPEREARARRIVTAADRLPPRPG